MPLDLYYFLPSPPCRAVLLAGKAVGVRLNLLEVCLLTGDNKTPEFREVRRVNPLQTVPTLNDDGFILYESRAIMRYLFNAYGKDDSLYPTDPRARAIVDQRLDFDAGTLIEKWRGCVRPVIHWNAKSISDDAKKQLKEIFQVLDGLIEECGGYCAGDHLTLADFSIIPIVSGAEVSHRRSGKFPPNFAGFKFFIAMRKGTRTR
ncbi:unnamed protein product [Darwinula stevensoni]|uniref:Glutathione S-transferase n=1 Tax=Darwinula stevensoni TaxID=69355 RepID=A0A7R9A8V5_9CRUS|nr:unnamed protein product [Darwinula stevensoni]CAG0896685.1 unnamed protein product [Darwinula stevensoni]